jgi:hypothetical protein
MIQTRRLESLPEFLELADPRANLKKIKYAAFLQTLYCIAGAVVTLVWSAMIGKRATVDLTLNGIEKLLKVIKGELSELDDDPILTKLFEKWKLHEYNIPRIDSFHARFKELQEVNNTQAHSTTASLSSTALKRKQDRTDPSSMSSPKRARSEQAPKSPGLEVLVSAAAQVDFNGTRGVSPFTSSNISSTSTCVASTDVIPSGTITPDVRIKPTNLQQLRDFWHKHSTNLNVNEVVIYLRLMLADCDVAFGPDTSSIILEVSV